MVEANQWMQGITRGGFATWGAVPRPPRDRKRRDFSCEFIDGALIEFVDSEEDDGDGEEDDSDVDSEV